MNEEDIYESELARPRWDELKVIIGPSYPIALSEDAPKELVKNVLGAVFAYEFGIESIDYTLKAYDDIFSNILSRKKNQIEAIAGPITKLIRDNITEEIFRIMEIKEKPDIVGLAISGAALIRLEASFRASIILIKQGMYIEGACLNRLILEQLAWAYNVCRIESRNVFDIPPHKCLKKLKQFVPEVGKLYGLLSKESHIYPEVIPSFVKVINDDVNVTIFSTEMCLKNTFYLLQLCDLFLMCSEYIYSELINDFNYLVSDSEGRLKPSNGRPLAAEIEHYRGLVDDYLAANL